jgi:hypothetical protein
MEEQPVVEAAGDKFQEVVAVDGCTVVERHFDGSHGGFDGDKCPCVGLFSLRQSGKK